MSGGPRALVVLGMHRSGTSVVARVLHELGANALQSLLEPANDNPDGCMESVEVVSLEIGSWKRRDCDGSTRPRCRPGSSIASRSGA